MRIKYKYVFCFEEDIEWITKDWWVAIVDAYNVEEAVDILKKEIEWEVFIKSIYREE